MIKKGFYFAAFLCGILVSQGSVAVEINNYPVLQKLVAKMTSKDGFPELDILRILGKAQIDQNTIDLMNRQYESLLWHKYRKIFISQNRIDQGVKFWNANQLVLDRAYEEFGVPQRVICAIIGVETHYGTQIGNKKVLNSLVTLSAEYPRRSKFFTAELRTFLNMTRKEKIDPETVVGSFAGAIGIPQFMPTSYEAYSVDFNGNNQRDLVNETDDAIGSVANYLSIHGWRRNQKIYANVVDSLPQSAVALVSKRVKLKHTTQKLITSGVKFDTNGSSVNASLVSLAEENSDRFIVGFKNFYAITRYNPSVNYAMVVSELAESIEKARVTN